MRTGLAAALLVLLPGLALAQAGSAAHPIAVHMKRGSDSVRLTGVLRQGRDCCAYRFQARAGQSLVWRESGAAVRVTMRYPDGHTDGPGLPNRILLPANGAYVFSVRPNLMADSGFGRFVLNLQIPPR
jgi:hypothetical protein